LNWILPGKMVELDFKNHGWKIETLNVAPNKPKYKCINANFYNDGHIIAKSRKSLIMASGDTDIRYDGKSYNNIYDLMKEQNLKTEDLDELELVETKEWIIVQGNIMIGQYEYEELPNRKDVE